MPDGTKHSYFYDAGGADEFSFYRIPKLLMTAEEYSDMSIESRFLYGLFLDRMSLSARNNWFDADGRAYIIFKIEAVMDIMKCSDKKATALMRELESHDLIERGRQGFGKPNLVYVKRYYEPRRRIENAGEPKKAADADTIKKGKARKPFVPPTLEEVREYVKSIGGKTDPENFYQYFVAGDWYDSTGKPVLNWKQKLQTWEKMNKSSRPALAGGSSRTTGRSYDYTEDDGCI